MKLYLVLTTQNGRDTTVASISPRLLTHSPREAVQAAKDVLGSNDIAFIEFIYIFAIDTERAYTMNEMRAMADDTDNEHLVLLFWKKDAGCSDEPSVTYRFNDAEFRYHTEDMLSAAA